MPAPQVLQDFHHKLSSAGAGFTCFEKTQYQAQLARFFTPSDGPKERRRLTAKTALKTPRLATLAWMRSLENGLQREWARCSATSAWSRTCGRRPWWRAR